MENKIKILRGYIDEVIPEDGSDKDTRFSNEELQRIINEQKSLFRAAYICWIIKAGMIQRELGNIDEYSAGNERYKLTNLTTALNAALNMARQYKQLADEEENAGVSGLILKFQAPEVL